MKEGKKEGRKKGRKEGSKERKKVRRTPVENFIATSSASRGREEGGEGIEMFSPIPTSHKGYIFLPRVMINSMNLVLHPS